MVKNVFLFDPRMRGFLCFCCALAAAAIDAID